jgi:hypothetical protein
MPPEIAMARMMKKLDDFQEQQNGKVNELPKMSPYPWEK